MSGRSCLRVIGHGNKGGITHKSGRVYTSKEQLPCWLIADVSAEPEGEGVLDEQRAADHGEYWRRGPQLREPGKGKAL